MMKIFLNRIKNFFTSRRGKAALAALSLLIIAGLLIFTLRINESRRINESSGADRLITTNNITNNSADSENKESSQYTLEIERLGVKAPIIPDVDAYNEAEYLKAIEGGVALMKDSALLGSAGLSFIFGHSKYYRDKPGNYKEVFKELDQLTAKDKIVIKSDQKTYIYKIFEYKTVDPEAWEEIYQYKNSEQNILVLMTCWPPGTLEKRYLVFARNES